jgi:hypothetical protein
MNRHWQRLRNALRFWRDEEEEATASDPSSRPPELEALRRHAAALTALASQARIELSALLRAYEERETEAKNLLKSGDEEAARPILARLSAQETELGDRAAQYEAQHHAAESAVSLYRRQEEAWQTERFSQKRSANLERAAAHARSVSEAAEKAPPASEPPASGEDRPGVAAAREALNRSSVSERMLP